MAGADENGSEDGHDKAGPLAGIRVVDLSSSYAGPTATMYLADLGAHVIKVESPPHGDDARRWGPPFIGEDAAWFWSANRNKKSLVLNLRDPRGLQVLDVLLGRAHVLVESMSPGKLHELGLDPDSVRQRFPSIVYCAISGFGLSGPDRLLAGYDLIAQARSGLMSVTGERGGRPQRVSTALSDVVTGLIACLAILAALRRAESTGAGDLIDVSLLDTDLALMAPRIASYLAGEPEPAPSGGTDSVIAIYQSFSTADRPVVLAVGSDRIWRRLCKVLDLQHLLEDESLCDNAGRAARRSELIDLIQERLSRDTADAWLGKFSQAGIPAGMVQSLSQVVTDPQVIARGVLHQLRREGDGAARVVGKPWRMDRDRAGTPVDKAPPHLAEHTERILVEHGLGWDQVRDLEAAGVVRIRAAQLSDSEGAGR